MFSKKVITKIIGVIIAIKNSCLKCIWGCALILDVILSNINGCITNPFKFLALDNATYASPRENSRGPMLIKACDNNKLIIVKL
ncbi:hypothetical protein KUF71_002646 [Frankliniella fusca]|uniref:Uncharacterized protein n=1 Tax=Frankliniella fusca TaxID=407009 RepID=A0AAE1LU43_9NEOP|nr:hypothetical protein KUF71_002646 [Frankliniella fusca]